MKTYARRHLLTLSREIEDTGAELAMLRERLVAESLVLDDLRLRMLIAETPLADRDLHVAALAVERLRRRIAMVESELRMLRAEERRLGGEAW